MKTITAKYKGNRILELRRKIDLPLDTNVYVFIPDEIRDNKDDETMKGEFQKSAEASFAKVWDNDGDEVWNEYL